jgi:3-oxoacyl-[acyl-carrier protein] reductase
MMTCRWLGSRIRSTAPQVPTKIGATPPALAANLCAYLASSESDGVTGRLISAQWDPWKTLHTHKDEFGDIYTLRRIVPEDRGKKWE